MSRVHYFFLQYRYLHFHQCIVTVSETKCIHFLGRGLTVWFGNVLLLLSVIFEGVTLLLSSHFIHSFIHSFMHIVHKDNICTSLSYCAQEPLDWFWWSVKVWRECFDIGSHSKFILPVFQSGNETDFSPRFPCPCCPTNVLHNLSVYCIVEYNTSPPLAVSTNNIAVHCHGRLEWY